MCTETKTNVTSDISLYLKRNEDGSLYELKTKFGNSIKVTSDHPVMTKNGMKNASNLIIGEHVIVDFFSGVEYDVPSDEIIIDLVDVERYLDKLGITNKGNARNQIINHLKKRNILPLRYNSPQLPIFIKLMGSIFGDGVLTFIKGKKGFTHFYGKNEDLVKIKDDIESLGYKTQKIFKRVRHHKIYTNYGVSEFDYEEHMLLKKATEFAIIFACLGVPVGRKTHCEYQIPEFLLKAPLWQKRLFLASLFGAELAKPNTSTYTKKNFYDLQFNMNKLEALRDDGKEFLNGIRLLLAEFGIASRNVVEVHGNDYNGKYGKTCGLRFLIAGNEENLIKFFSTIGYEYNSQKKRLASLATAYLKHKDKVRSSTVKQYASGNQIINCRVSKNMISFDQFIHEFGYGDFVVDEIEEIILHDYNGPVYDLTVNNLNHNFIANNFIISNCGMKLLTTNLTFKDVEPKLKEIVDTLFKTVPAGVGCKGFVKINQQQFKDVISEGAKWCVNNGYGWQEDLDRIEGHGRIDWADPEKVSNKAMERGLNQIGTLGSGNHYLEIQLAQAKNIYDQGIAKKFGITQPDQVVIMVHCGSRGFGHQLATDYLRIFLDVMKREKIQVKDPELACAPFRTKEGQDYYRAMACAANMAFANRQVILHRIREVFEKVFKRKAEEMEMHTVYDVAHNVAKLEKHKVDGKMKELIVHRKGSTRAFGPGNPELWSTYKETGQPVIIGGSMETGSALLVGTKKAEDETFGSTAHGSGRTMSRTQAKREFRGEHLQKDMERRGIYVRTTSYSGLAEEAGAAYKDLPDVLDACSKAGISKPVIALRPIGNIKG